MKHGAPFVVKQFAPMIGAPAGTRTRRLRVVYFAYSVAEALTVATRRGYPACWIERRDAPAWRRR